MKDYLGVLKEKIDKIDVETIERIAKILKNRRVFIIGNGGSAANAIHWANDLQKEGHIDITALTNISLITAWGNDLHYDTVFKKQLERMAQPGDVLVILSGSGDSDNLVSAYHWARDNNLYTVNIIGKKYGYLNRVRPMSEVLVFDAGMQHSEDLQLVVCHMVTNMLQD